MKFEQIVNGEIKNSPVPWGKDNAIKLGYTKYTLAEKCHDCNTNPVSRYVENDVCVMCSIPMAYEVWKLWVMGSPDRPDPFPRNRDDAKAAGMNFYYLPEVCKGGCHFKQPHINTGRCQQCANSKNPRQLAKHKGLSTYQPDTPCRNCGTDSRRKVDNNDCLNCGNKTSNNRIMTTNPDAIITREDAQMLGLNVYRTGEPCRKGHKGWRYRSTGGCIQCLKGDPLVPGIPAKNMPVIPISQQLTMFIGYSYHNHRFNGPDGKKRNKMQFSANFPVMALYETRTGTVTTAADAFISNFC